MSIFIRGMEMPENCEKCIYLSWSNFYQIYTCNAIRKEEPVIFNQKKTNSTAVVRSGRADNCPLAEVPTSHGRLIDADALLLKIDIVCGWKMGLTVWGIGFALALIIATAMCLIDEGD